MAILGILIYKRAWAHRHGHGDGHMSENTDTNRIHEHELTGPGIQDQRHRIKCTTTETYA